MIPFYELGQMSFFELVPWDDNLDCGFITDDKFPLKVFKDQETPKKEGWSEIPRILFKFFFTFISFHIGYPPGN